MASRSSPTRQRRLGPNRAETVYRDSVKEETDDRTEITTSMFNKNWSTNRRHTSRSDHQRRDPDEEHHRDFGKTANWFSNAVHPWRFEQGGRGLQHRVRSHLQRGERGADWVKANHRCNPMPSLLESQKECCSVHAEFGFDQTSTRWTRSSSDFAEPVKPYYRVLVNKSRGLRHWTPSLGKHEMTGTRPHWEDGTKTNETEQDKQKSMTRLMSGSNTSIVSPQPIFRIQHPTFNESVTIFWRTWEAMTQTSRQDQFVIGQIGDKLQKQCWASIVNCDISLLFHWAEEHDETTKLILQSKHTWSGCEQNTLTRHISSCFTHTHFNVARDIGSRCLAHVIHVSSACCCCLDTLRPSSVCSPPSLSFSFSFSCSSPSSSMSVGSMRSPMRTSANDELGTMAENNPLTGHEPRIIDNYHFSETMKFSSRSPPATAGPQICMTWSSMTTPSAERSSPLFQEREDPASRRQVYHYLDESLSSGELISMSLDH